MSTTFPGRIEIGGRLPRSLLDKFAELADLENAGFDWANDEPLTARKILAWIKDEPIRTLQLMSSDAYYGHFETFEKWLIDHEMSFLVTSDSYCEYEATINGTVNGVAFHVDANQSGDPIIEMRHAEAALEALKEGRVFDAADILTRVVRPVPIVPPFEVIDDRPKRAKRKKRKK